MNALTDHIINNHTTLEVLPPQPFYYTIILNLGGNNESTSLIEIERCDQGKLLA